jgi:glucose-1-phosphate thymidylyltransferase
MRKIKGIILAGGKGTRLYPLTKVTNKHLLPLGGEPMINHPIRKLVEAGIEDIMIITGVEHCGNIMTLLGSGKEYGCSFTYRVQDEPDGIAGALQLCRDFVGDDTCAVILGDNIFKDSLKSYVTSFKISNEECRLFFKRVADPRRYGVGVFKKDRLIRVDEKPLKPQTNLACIGIYFYSNKVFDVIDKIKRSDRGEYEISTVNNFFIGEDICSFDILEGKWSDAGTMGSYHETNWAVYKGD